MPAGHAGRLVWEPRANTGRDADMPPLPCRADRYYSAEGPGRARRSRCGGFARHTWDDARIARTLAFIQRHSIDDYLSSCLPAAEPVAFRETESLGRHDASARTTRKTDQRKTAKRLQYAPVKNCINLCARCKRNSQRHDHRAYFAAWNLDGTMQGAGASVT